MNERTFDARLRTFQVKGEYKIDSDGEITAEPELVIQFSVPLDTDTPELAAFLEQVKAAVGGKLNVTIASPQAAFDFGAAVARTKTPEPVHA